MRCPQLIIVLFWQGSSISVKSVNKDDANNWDLDWQISFGGSGVDLLCSQKLTTDGGNKLAGIPDSNKVKIVSKKWADLEKIFKKIN